MSRLFHRSLLWGDFLEILSFLTINDVYRYCGRLNRAGFVAFLRERATRQCPKESASKSRFLSSGLNHQKILLVSYPRSGNSYLRRLLELSFGIVTGSDSRPNRTLSESLLRCGFKGRAWTFRWLVGTFCTRTFNNWIKSCEIIRLRSAKDLDVTCGFMLCMLECRNVDGWNAALMTLNDLFHIYWHFIWQTCTELTLFLIGEGVVDDSVWMVKTHYPERLGYLKFRARRIVLLVRNPFDAIESYFHMGMTNTHDKHLSPQVIINITEVIQLLITVLQYTSTFYICEEHRSSWIVIVQLMTLQITWMRILHSCQSNQNN